MLNVLVVGLAPDSFLKSLILQGPLHRLKTAAKAQQGLQQALVFKKGAYHFAALTWDNSDAVEGFQNSEAMRLMHGAAKRADSLLEAHAFVASEPPTKDEAARLWHTARHADSG